MEKNKPKVEQRLVFDILEVLHYMESIGYDGIYNTIWDYITDTQDVSNYTYIDAKILSGRYTTDPAIIQDLGYIEQEFGDLSKGLMHIFW